MKQERGVRHAMIDNKALSPEAWFHTKRALACVEALNKVGFTAVYAATREEAVKTVLDAVSEGSTVGIGGSVTVRELGLPEALKRKGCKVRFIVSHCLLPVPIIVPVVRLSPPKTVLDSYCRTVRGAGDHRQQEGRQSDTGLRPGGQG